MIQSPLVKTGVKTSVSKFIKEARAELRKVVWPTKKQLVNLTIIVLGVSLVTGLFIGGLDYVFTQLVGLIIK
jgi:preprotein translocase subunit SecE